MKVRGAFVVASALAMLATTFVAAPAPSVGAATANPATVEPLCSQPVDAHMARCFAVRAVQARALSVDGVDAPGYHPGDLWSAYGLGNPITSGQGTGQTIAIIDAYDNPNAEDDLAVYRDTFHLPPCTTANGCFTKVNQDGDAGPLPGANVEWAAEISLDLDMASAICPNCHLLLVEADSAVLIDLAQSVDKAVELGATVVSNSYGRDEFVDEIHYADYYKHPGVPITVSSGDAGYHAGPQFPATFVTVVAVGGTRLARTKSTARGWNETAWATDTRNAGGSGCSKYRSKGVWQKNGGCSRRSLSDVSAVADPFTGVSVYDTFTGGAPPGWQMFGGTSASAPIVAGIYALAGNGERIGNASYAYYNKSGLNDPVSGSNGTCSIASLCNAQKGWDGPTGVGTPHGTTGF